RVALLGAELADYDLAAVDSVPMPEMGGCMGGANEAHPYPWIAVVEDSPTTLYEDLLDQMRAEAGDPYGERFARSADLDALNAEWRACFERDFSLAGPTVPADGSVAVGDPSDRLASESDGPTGAWDLAIYTDADGAYSDAAVGEAPPEYSSLTGSPREVAIAVADFKCRVETDYVDRFLGIEREAQEEFVAAHKAELDKMAAALEAYVNS
ncbi:MAG: hypothetical protein LBD77_06305, partial [Bifidobacteriaceae bacterium]|nr:hypothetical protein [Bifidobacteriaceae bacterium]